MPSRRKSILRGAEIYGLGILFRIQEYVLGYPISPWTDLFRVDILNILGISMMLMGAAVLADLVRYAGAKFNQPDCDWSATPCHLADQSSVRSTRSCRIRGPGHAAALDDQPAELAAVATGSYLNGVHVFGSPNLGCSPFFPGLLSPSPVWRQVSF